jgi:tricorn protease
MTNLFVNLESFKPYNSLMQRFFQLLRKSTLILFIISYLSSAQDTRLLRQPDISDTHIVFTYGSDVWIVETSKSEAKRLTSTAAVESQPYFSPDGQWIAFTSNRSGRNQVYLISKDGGTPKQLTWHPSGSEVRGWSPDGEYVLLASSRDTAPSPYNRLYKISYKGGAPELLTLQWSHDGAFSPDGRSLVIDRMDRWDTEWRAYRGGQNTPLILLDLETQNERLLPNDKTTDVQPLWLDNTIYFLSDRDLVTNIWSYNTTSKSLQQITNYKGSDIKWLSAHKNTLIFERNGYFIYTRLKFRQYHTTQYYRGG